MDPTRPGTGVIAEAISRMRQRMRQNPTITVN